MDFLLKLHNLIHPYATICGGACRSILQKEPVKDYDIFLTKEEYYSTVKTLVLSLRAFEDTEIKENDLMFQCGNIQIIKPTKDNGKLTYGKPEDVVNTFDFTVCRVWFDGSTFQHIDDSFVEDCAHKRLVVKNIICPVSTMRRALKYTSKGYFMDLKQVLTLFFNFKERDPNYQEFMLRLQGLEGEGDGVDGESIYELMQIFNID